MRAETPLREKKGLVRRSGRKQSVRTNPKTNVQLTSYHS